jgi:hypothetical protein
LLPLCQKQQLISTMADFRHHHVHVHITTYQPF